MNRLTSIQKIRGKLNSGGCSIGSWMQIPHASIAEIMGQSGYDWVAIDMEHGSIASSQLPDLFRALELGNTLPLARIAEGTPKDCKQALDAGAGGIIVPMIETAEQLISVRDACRWPPSGSRGVGYSRANLFGKNFKSYSEEAQAPLLIAMIESIHAVKNLDEILKVKGLDAIMVGPYDLSASMGINGEFDRAEFINLLELIKQCCTQNNKSCGLHLIEPSIENLELKIATGYGFIAYSIDAIFLQNICDLPLKK
jgi:2-dehydro-3-deoxyglucarate aldolase